MFSCAQCLQEGELGHSAKSAPVHDEERDHEGDADQGYNEDGPEVARLSDHRVELDDVL